MEEELDLMDWKNVETSTEQTIRTAKITIALDSIMLRHAKREIIRLDGKTSEEEKRLEEQMKAKISPSPPILPKAEKGNFVKVKK